MDWSKSYTARWHIYRVNTNTWADSTAIGNVDSVQVTKTADGALLESGSMEVSDDFINGYYRVVMVAEQDSDVERVEVATLLFECHAGRYDYGSSTRTAEGRSVLYPASTKKLLAGSYAPAGIDGARYAQELLQDAISAPVVVSGSFTLNENVVHDFSSSVLDAAWAVLSYGGFIMQIDGHGQVNIRKMPTGTSLSLDNANLRLLEPGIDFEDDMTDIPNRFTAINGDESVTITNNLAGSVVSTRSRGYVSDYVEDNAVPCDGETLDSYARRRLEELSLLSDSRTYKREWVSGVYPYSLVNASLPNYGLDGKMRVISQSLECSHGIEITEKATREVALWEA